MLNDGEQHTALQNRECADRMPGAELCAPLYTRSSCVLSCPPSHSQSTLTLSPSSPGACFQGDRKGEQRLSNATPLLGGKLTGAADVTCADGSCQITAQLEGDFAAYEGAPDLGSKYLFMSSLCDKPWELECSRRMFVRPTTPPWRGVRGGRVTCGNGRDALPVPQEDSQYSMLVDRHLTTNGDECNKIGVSYEAFALQSNACYREYNSCLENQLKHLYDVRGRG